jgi:predicted metalloprotease with PDZ domain
MEAMGGISHVTFFPVTLETLVDSPVLIGEHMKRVPLGEQGTAEAEREVLNLAGDSEAAIGITVEQAEMYRRLVAEANALFGAHHYRQYNFLYALSDNVAHFGLEHHESSDNRVPERTLLDEHLFRANADLLAHEMVHSWNGKYRRPAGLATDNFQEVMRSPLLWVYEGLTQYLGEVLTARSGLLTTEQARENLARLAAELDHRPGRTWRPLEDTATAAQTLYGASNHWLPWRRGVDFYDEGTLIWLEADTMIRKQTNGAKTLDDFCKRFHGAPSGPPKVVPYSVEDVIAAMNETAAYDWRGFFTARVEKTSKRAPLAGIEASGWKLVYTDVKNTDIEDLEKANEITEESYSIGVQLTEGGTVNFAIPGMAAYAAGIGPGMRIIAVNGKRYSDDVLRDALRASKDPATKLELLMENGNYFSTHAVEYHGGLRYPHLERGAGTADLLSEIWKGQVQK